MFSNYVAAAMRHAAYEVIDDPEPYYGHIPELRGVWATGKTLAACQDELRSSLEDWLVLGIALHHDMPPNGPIKRRDLIKPRHNLAAHPQGG